MVSYHDVFRGTRDGLWLVNLANVADVRVYQTASVCVALYIVDLVIPLDCFDMMGCTAGRHHVKHTIH